MLSQIEMKDSLVAFWLLFWEVKSVLRCRSSVCFIPVSEISPAVTDPGLPVASDCSPTNHTELWVAQKTCFNIGREEW